MSEMKLVTHAAAATSSSAKVSAGPSGGSRSRDMSFPYDGHPRGDESLPWPPDGGLDRAYRRAIRARLAAGRTLLQAELDAFAAVAPAIAPQDRAAFTDWGETEYGSEGDDL